PMMGSVDHFTLHLYGRGGHGAQPHETRDSIVIGSQLIGHLQQIVSRRINPVNPAVVTVGKFHSGDAFNIIADKAIIEGTVRTLDKKVRKQIEEEIRNILEGTKMADNIDYDLDYVNGYPVLVNDANEVIRVKRLINQFDDFTFQEVRPTLGAEDFAYYLQQVPGAFIYVGARDDSDKQTHYPHHHPKFNFDEKALLNSGKIFLSIAHDYLIQETENNE